MVAPAKHPEGRRGVQGLWHLVTARKATPPTGHSGWNARDATVAIYNLPKVRPRVFVPASSVSLKHASKYKPSGLGTQAHTTLWHGEHLWRRAAASWIFIDMICMYVHIMTCSTCDMLCKQSVRSDSILISSGAVAADDWTRRYHGAIQLLK